MSRDVAVNQELGSLEYDDGVKRRTVATGSMVDVRDWGARPGNNDMTSEIQAAATGCPTDATLVFPSGLYNISDTIWFAGDYNVIADGVTFHLGTATPSTAFAVTGVPENHDGTSYLGIVAREAGALTTLATVVWGRRDLGQSADPRPKNRFFRGLTVNRTPVGVHPSTPSQHEAAAKKYAAFVVVGAERCTLEDIILWNHREGLVLTSNGEGCVLNRLVRIETLECRYAITLHAADSGWTNSNYIEGGTASVSSDIASLSLSDPTTGSYVGEQWELIRILKSTTTSNAPNANSIQNFNLETNRGRQLRLECSDGVYINNRHEGTSDAADNIDITIGELTRLNSEFQRNMFMGGGLGFHNVVGNNRIEYLATFGGINVSNSFMSGDRAVFFGDRSTTGAKVSIGGGGNDSPLLAFQDRTFTNPGVGLRKDKMIGYAEIPAGILADCFAGFEWYDAAATVRNVLAMRDVSPWDLRTLAGLTIGGDLVVVGAFSMGALGLPQSFGSPVLMTFADDSGDLEISPNTAVRVLHKGEDTNRTFDFYNVTNDNNDCLRILDSNKDVRMSIKAGSAEVTGTHYSAILFYEETTPGSPTFANSIGLTVTTSGGAAKSHLIAFEKGIWVNRAQADHNSWFSSNGQLYMLFVDGGTNRIGIGTSAPDKTLQVVGDVHVDNELIVDEGVTMAITEVSGHTTLDATHYTVLVDASGGAVTITLPAAASHSGRIYNIKKIDSTANIVTIDPNSAELIDGIVTLALIARNEKARPQSDATEWWTI